MCAAPLTPRGPARERGGEAAKSRRNARISQHRGSDVTRTHGQRSPRQPGALRQLGGPARRQGACDREPGGAARRHHHRNDGEARGNENADVQGERRAGATAGQTKASSATTTVLASAKRKAATKKCQKATGKVSSLLAKRRSNARGPLLSSPPPSTPPSRTHEKGKAQRQRQQRARETKDRRASACDMPGVREGGPSLRTSVDLQMWSCGAWEATRRELRCPLRLCGGGGIAPLSGGRETYPGVCLRRNSRYVGGGPLWVAARLGDPFTPACSQKLAGAPRGGLAP